MPCPATAPGRFGRLTGRHITTQQMMVEIARAFLLVDDNGSQPSPDMRIHRLPVSHPFLTAQPVISHPAFDVGIELPNAALQRLPPVAWSHLLQPGFDSLHRFAREMDGPL